MPIQSGLYQELLLVGQAKQMPLASALGKDLVALLRGKLVKRGLRQELLGLRRTRAVDALVAA